LYKIEISKCHEVDRHDHRYTDPELNFKSITGFKFILDLNYVQNL